MIEFKNFIFILFFFLLILNYSCTPKVFKPSIIENFYVSKNEFSNSTISFQSIFNNYLKSKNKDTLFIESGIYTINEKIYSGIINKDIVIIGLGNVTIKVSSGFAFFTSPTVYEGEYTEELTRGSNIINVKINREFINNSKLILFILSNDFIEDGWKYKKGELCSVDYANDNHLYLLDTLLFPYKSNEKTVIKIYDAKRITLKNIVFELKNWNEEQVLSTHGCFIEGDNIKFKNFKKDNNGLFWGIYCCSNIQINNLSLYNGNYGVGIDYSKDVSINNVISDNTLHPIVPATFTKNIYINKVRGNNTVIDAHPCFNVHYNDVKINTGMELFNCRSLGVKLTNCIFTCDKNNEQNAIGIGLVGLKKEYEFLYKEYDVIIHKVIWKHKIRDYNGLHVPYCRNFLVDSSEVNQISSGSFLNNFIVTNTKLGYFRSYDSNFKIENCIFDASLQGNKLIKPPIWCSYSGKAIISNNKFIGFNNEIFDYVSSEISEITFEKCEFYDNTKFVKTFEFPNKQYKYIKFNNCELKKIREIPFEFNSNRHSLLNKNKLGIKINK